jgi:hypothetical protein
MAIKRGGILPFVMQSVDVGNWDSRKLLVADIDEASKIDPIYFSDGRIVSNAKSADTAIFAEIVMILLRVKQILRKF